MGMKRANGTGSVYKRKDGNRRKPYRAIVTIGYTDSGKAIRKIIGDFEKSKDAIEALAQFTSGTFVNIDKIKFKDVWSMMIEEKKRIRKSIDTSFKMAETRLTPIWDTEIHNIKTMHLQALFDDMNSLSLSSLKTIKSLLVSTFGIAMKNDYVQKNYAKLIILPSTDNKEPIHKSYTEDDLRTLWANTNNDISKLLLVYIYTGLRPVELLHIKIEDIHLKERYMIGGVKTKAGINRIIPIAECIYPFVKELYQKGAFHESKLLGAGKETWWLRRQTDKICKELQITRHAAHDTRHTFITLAANHGMDDKILKMIVGHASANDITKSVYVHKNIKQLIDAVNLLPYGTKMSLYPASVWEQRGSNG